MVKALGRIGLQLTGQSPLMDYLNDEFTHQPAGSQADVICKLVEHLPRPSEHTAVGEVLVGHGWIQVRAEGVTYRVDVADDITTIRLLPAFDESRRRLPITAQRAASWNFLSADERLGKVVIYDILDYVTQIAQLGKGQTYIHASAVAKNGLCLLMPAWGGVGKSSAMLRLVRDYGYQYLADDLAILSDDGIVHRHPKRMQVYAYNLDNDKDLQRRLLGERTRIDRAAWTAHLRLKGPKGVRRRVSAHELFGAAGVATEAAVDQVIMLRRASVGQVHVRPISTSDLISRCAWTLVHELSPLTMISCAAQSAGSTVVPDLATLQESSLAVMRSGFANADTLELVLPLEATPKDLIEGLKPLLR